MNILGINGSPNPVHENEYGINEWDYHDAAAALLVDGKTVSAFEEERLNRIKHTNKWPRLAIDACLKFSSLDADKIDLFAFNTSERRLDQALALHFGEKGVPPPSHTTFLQQLLEEQFQSNIDGDKIFLCEHHNAHAATAFYPSMYEDALVLTIDGWGGEYSGSVYEGHSNDLKLLHTYDLEQSLGLFYGYITQILGFGHFDEYKVMGLAPYGNPATYRSLFEEYYTLLPDGNYLLRDYREGILAGLVPAWDKSTKLSQVHKDIAASLQETLEKIVFHIARSFKNLTRMSRLCLAGGVALNCTLNGKLINSGLFEDVYVFPGANDSGLPLGGALLAYFKKCKSPRREPIKSLYLGSAIGNTDAILDQLEQWKEIVQYDRQPDITRKSAALLADSKVIGWVQGSAEFAPRALGNRSILADPRPEENRERINFIVKKREGFRPFAPSVLEEEAAEYFELPGCRKDFAHMIYVFKVREKYRKQLGAITHVDGTARVQTVSRSDNPKYWELINEFNKITGTPVLLNTSFNNNAEPIVDGVHDAVVCFLTTDLDFLVIDDFLVEKKGFELEHLSKLYICLPPYSKLRKLDLPDTYELGNSFNDKKKDLSPEMFRILSEVNGQSSIGCLLKHHSVSDGPARTALLKEFTILWEKRMISLRPAPSVNSNILHKNEYAY